MPIYDQRDPRYRSALYRNTSAATDPRNGQQVSPLSLARTATDEYTAEAAPPPQGVQVAQAQPVGSARPDPYRDMYGRTLGEARGALESLPGALDEYNAARNASFDQQAQVERDYLNTLQPEKSQQMGRFGAALLTPTSTGSFFEAFGKATNAALDQRGYEQKRKDELAEKRARSEMALAKIAGERIQDPMRQLNDRMTIMEAADKLGGYQADFEIGNGPTPSGDDALLADYRANPMKYRGARGQQMVADAQARVTAAAKTADERKWWLQQQDYQSRLKREEDAAKAAAEGTKPTPLDRAEANRVAKRLAETQTSASEASKLKADIAALRAARAGTGYEGGLGADTFATVGGWLGIDSAENMQTIRAQAENLRLGLSSQLKGAISDKDMQLLGNATAGLGMTDDAAEPLLKAQEAAAQRAIERSQFMQRWVQANGSDYGADEMWSVYTQQNPLFAQNKDGSLKLNEMSVGNWRDYVTGPNGQPASGGQGQSGQPQGGSQAQGLLVDPNTLPPNVKAWAEQQLRNGIPAEQVVERINNHIRNKTGAPQ